jgi:hypothetical protein
MRRFTILNVASISRPDRAYGERQLVYISWLIYAEHQGPTRAICEAGAMLLGFLQVWIGWVNGGVHEVRHDKVRARRAVRLMTQ